MSNEYQRRLMQLCIDIKDRYIKIINSYGCKAIHIDGPHEIYVSGHRWRKVITKINQLEMIYPSDIQKPGEDVAIVGMFIVASDSHTEEKRLIIDLKSMTFCTTFGSYVPVNNYEQVCIKVQSLVRNTILGVA